MNKKSVILGVIIIVVVSLLTTGCIFYNVLDSQDFKEHFGALGYTISDTEEGLYDASNYLVASKSDVSYKIEYYEFNEEVEAKKIYKKYKDNIANYITSESSNLETTGAVFTRVVAESEKEYIAICRVKNTLIFVAGTQEYKLEIEKLLEDIKY